MHVSVVIINYNTFDLTCQCIRSIFQYTLQRDLEIILVDNASTREDPDDFLKLFPTVKLIKSPQNLGFAGGNNLGIKHASGDIILLLNSDTYLLEDSISVTRDFLDSHPDAGFVSCRLVYEDRVYQKNARKFRSIRNELLDLARPLLLLLPYRKRAELMLNQYFKGDFDTMVDWLSGAFIMFRKELLQKLPGQMLDERYFMYGEDHLWGYQVHSAGYRNYFTSATSVVHIANASTEPAKQLQLEKTMISRELDLMQYRTGKSLYYYIFALIYTTKEQLRYQVKVLIKKIFRYRVR